MDNRLREQLLALEAEDLRVRSELLQAVYTLEDPAHVDDMRATVGLPPLTAFVASHGEQTALPLAEVLRERAEMDRWARSVGWRS